VEAGAAGYIWAGVVGVRAFDLFSLNMAANDGQGNAMRPAKQFTRAPLVWVMLCGLAMPALADSLLGGLREKAAKAMDHAGEAAGSAVEAVGKATDTVVDHATQTVESAQQDLRDEASPAETRAKLDAMAEATLQRLFTDKPDSRALFDASVGYAVFDTRQVSYVVAAGYGRGVAVDRATGGRTYMKMGSAGAGVSFGLGGFDTQFVILFETQAAFDEFITQGIDATAEAGTMAGDEQEQLALRFQQGRAVFVLTQKGWKVSARLSGTRYWPDAELN
jgi:lipid-binding SYLF domain-containing protein